MCTHNGQMNSSPQLFLYYAFIDSEPDAKCKQELWIRQQSHGVYFWMVNSFNGTIFSKFSRFVDVDQAKVCQTCPFRLAENKLHFSASRAQQQAFDQYKSRFISRIKL